MINTTHIPNNRLQEAIDYLTENSREELAMMYLELLNEKQAKEFVAELDEFNSDEE